MLTGKKMNEELAEKDELMEKMYKAVAVVQAIPHLKL